MFQNSCKLLKIATPFVLFFHFILLFAPNRYGAVPPHPLISVGKPVFASPQENKDKLTDGIWKAHWGNWSCGKDSWFAVNIGSGPDSVLVCFNNYNYSWSDAISNGGACVSTPDLPVEYRFFTSSNSSNGTDGTWNEVVHITDNSCSARMHTFAFNGQSWIKMEVVSTSTPTISVGEIEVFDISDGNSDTWFFLGNSITAMTMKGKEDLGENSFENLIFRFTNSVNRPAVLRGGIPCIKSVHVSSVIDNYYKVASDAKYWAILLGTNDAWGGSPNGCADFKKNMQTIIDFLLDKKIVPILGKIPATKKEWQIHPDYLVAIDELIEKNDLIGGPDFYTWFLNYPDQLDDGVHPNDEGIKSLQRLWAEFARNTIYGDPTPVQIPYLHTPATGISLFPNPATTTIDIRTPQPMSLKIISLRGATLASYQIIERSSVDISQLPKGIFAFTFKSQEQVQVRLVVKH